MATLRVNGKEVTVSADPATPLLYVLRNDAGLMGRGSAAVLGNAAPAPCMLAMRCALCARFSSVSADEITTLEFGHAG